MTIMIPFVLLMLIQTPPAEAEAPAPLPPRVEVAEVLDGFVKHVAASGIDPQTIAFVQTQYSARRGAENAAALLDECLAVLSQDFRQGLEAAEAAQPDRAAAIFSRLAESDDPYLAVNSAFFAVQALIEQEKLRETSELLADLVARHEALTRYTAHGDHLMFLYAYTQAHMLQYDAATIALRHFLQNYPDAPERFRMTAQQMLTELERREPNRLGDVHDLMNYARRELFLGRTDQDVKQHQDKAVDLLNQLIKEAEEEEKKKGQGGGKGGGRGRRSRNRSRQQQSNPREQSEMTPSGEGGRDLDKIHKANPEDMWGKMPPKERDAVLQALQKQFPSRYRDLVEQYYRQLSKDSPRP